MNGGAEIVSSADPDHAPGAVIAAKYTLLHPLGVAGEGLWLARYDADADTDADAASTKPVVALQLVRPLAQRVGAAEAFDRELNKVAALSQPNLLLPLDHGCDEHGVLYVAYEWVKGRTLAQVLREDWPLPDGAMRGIVLQLLAALEAAHAAGLSHGDLQPGKIILRAVTEGGEPAADAPPQLLLRGLGLAEFVPYRFEQPPPEHLSDVTTEWIVGRPEYAAPEQLLGELPSPSSDVYAAGVLMFQLLTRTVPFAAASPYDVAFMQRFSPPEPPSAFALVNPAVEAICLRALSKTPELRFESAAEMRKALLDAQTTPVNPIAPARSSTSLAIERALAPVLRASSAALAPVMRVSSAALAPVLRASSAALAPVMRVSSAALAPVFRADLLSGAPVEAPARVARPGRPVSPMLLAAAAGVIALSAAPWWLHSEEADAADREQPPSGSTREPRVARVARVARVVRVVTDAPSQPDGVAISLSPAPAPAGLSAGVRAAPPSAELARSEREPAAEEAAEPPSRLRITTANAPATASLTPTQKAERATRAQHAEPRPSERADRVVRKDQAVLAKIDPSSRGSTAKQANGAEHSPAQALAGASKAAVVLVAPSAGAAQIPSVGPITFLPGPSARAEPSEAAAPAARLIQPSPAPLGRPQPLAAKTAGHFSVELGEPVTSRRSVSRGALRSALNPEALARCYRDAVGPQPPGPSTQNATLELTTDLSGRVRTAQLKGAKLRPALVDCVESHARRSRVREGDSGGAMQAAVALTFHAD